LCGQPDQFGGSLSPVLLRGDQRLAYGVTRFGCAQHLDQRKATVAIPDANEPQRLFSLGE
jgi:hypothetical protein